MVTELLWYGEGVLWIGKDEHWMVQIHGRKAGVLLRGTTESLQLVAYCGLGRDGHDFDFKIKIMILKSKS